MKQEDLICILEEEIGHGELAEKALRPVIPEIAAFPYVIRVVSEVLSQSGSSSMASTCGSTVALMDAGVPIKAPVAGIAIGLVVDDNNMNNYKLVVDMADKEDFLEIWISKLLVQEWE